MQNHSECTTLATRFEKMAASGLRDVRFFVRTSDEATAETLCGEVNLLYDAVDRGEESPLDFKDASRS